MPELILYGTVGESFWGEDYFTARMVRDQLAELEGDLTVRLNSGGGIASEGQAIYTALKDYPGRVTVQIEGVAASAASLIAMAGDEIVVRLGAWMLIHDPAQAILWDGRGTADEHRGLAAFLDKIADGYAEVYAARAGLSREAAREIMRVETVYLGEEAVAAGFATAFEGATPALEPAAFDYRIYAHAPQAAREAHQFREASAPRKEAVSAMIAGEGARMKQEKTAMPDKQTSQAPTAQTSSAPQAATPPAPAPAPAPEPQASTPAPAPQASTPAPAPAPAPAPEMSGAQVARLFSMGTRLGATTAQIEAAIEGAGGNFETALDAISAALEEGAGSAAPMHGRPTARILRDERDTRREGMTMALEAQLARTAPDDDRARPFMEMGLAEMAAASSGYNGPLRSAGDRLRAFEMAAHSTSDFPGVLGDALNRRLAAAYEASTPTFRAIALRTDFTDFRVHHHVNIGDFPTLEKVAENGEIKSGTVGESDETAQLTAYGRVLNLSRQMLVNDDLGAIDRVLNSYGMAVADFEEATFWAFALGGPTLSDEVAVFHADHANLGSASAISNTALDAGRKAIRTQTRIDGKRKVSAGFAPAFLVCGPAKEGEAETTLTPVVAADGAKINRFASKLEAVITNEITGNDWYLFADPARPGAEVFSYGYLNGAEAPRLRMDEPFGRQGMSASVEHDFGIGAVGFRGAWKNPGA